jgi:hypothetical protein
MVRQRVLIIGSLKMDRIVPIDQLPGPGETVSDGAILRTAAEISRTLGVRTAWEEAGSA